MKAEVFRRSAGQIPIGLFDADHLSPLTGNASTGQEVRWVGEDHIHGVFREFVQ